MTVTSAITGKTEELADYLRRNIEEHVKKLSDGQAQSIESLCLFALLHGLGPMDIELVQEQFTLPDRVGLQYRWYFRKKAELCYHI